MQMSWKQWIVHVQQENRLFSRGLRRPGGRRTLHWQRDSERQREIEGDRERPRETEGDRGTQLDTVVLWDLTKARSLSTPCYQWWIRAFKPLYLFTRWWSLRPHILFRLGCISVHVIVLSLPWEMIPKDSHKAQLSSHWICEGPAACVIWNVSPCPVRMLPRHQNGSV